MTLKNTLKKRIKKAVDIPRWVNYSQWAALNRSLLLLAKDIFSLKKIEQPESFSQVIHRFQLTEADLIVRQHRFRYLTRLWLTMFVVVFSYGVYLVVQAAWLGVMPAMVLTSITLCQAFRYHFWLFQLTQQRLGCTLTEWAKDTFGKWVSL